MKPPSAKVGLLVPQQPVHEESKVAEQESSALPRTLHLSFAAQARRSRD